MKKIKRIIDKITSFTTGFFRDNWKKNVLIKFLLILLVVAVWPLFFITIAWNLYHKYNSPIKRWLMIGIFTVISLPLTVVWFTGFSDSPPTSNINEATKQPLCIGPDGKEIQLSKKACEELNDAWKNNAEKEPKLTEPFADSKSITKDQIRDVVSPLEDIGYGVMGGKELSQIKIDTDLSNDDLSAKYEDMTKIIHLYYKPEAWDEKNLMTKATDTAVAVMEKLFANKNISSVWIWVMGDFTDQYGKTTEGTGIRIGLKRTTAEKIEWKNFKEMVLLDYNKLLNIADEVYIHPAVKKAL